jgi:hypothetical protein
MVKLLWSPIVSSTKLLCWFTCFVMRNGKRFLLYKNLLLLIVTTIATSVNGQTSVYHPFPDSNAYWTVHVSDCCWSSCCSPGPGLGDYNFTYSISGDTIINATSYHKIYKSGSTHLYCNIFDPCLDIWYYYNSYYGGIRQDTLLKKIFFIDNSSMECLLYDFSAIVGGTMSCQFFYPITSIDSVLIGSNYRKRFNLSCISVLEGIGSISGLMELFCPFEAIGTLVCFSQNGQTYYPDTTANCEFLTSVNTISNKQMQANIFPNPIHSSATLQLKKDFINGDLKIYNSFGEQVRQHKIISETTIINRNGLVDGIYFYQVTNGNGIVTTGRLMIE